MRFKLGLNLDDYWSENDQNLSFDTTRQSSNQAQRSLNQSNRAKDFKSGIFASSFHPFSMDNYEQADDWENWFDLFSAQLRWFGIKYSTEIDGDWALEQWREGEFDPGDAALNYIRYKNLTPVFPPISDFLN